MKPRNHLVRALLGRNRVMKDRKRASKLVRDRKHKQSNYDRS